MGLRLFLAAALLALIVGGTACTAPNPKPTVSPLSPVPTRMVAPVGQPFTTATNQPNTGVVSGCLIVQGSKTTMVSRDVYLAAITDSGDGNFSAAALQQSSPASVTDGNGCFVFVNVQPGRYGLILEAILDTVLLSDITTGKPIVVTVSPNKTVELGKIEVLPGH